MPDTPPDAVVGNIGAGDICPSSWHLAHDRADIITRVILARFGDTVDRVYDNPPGQLIYGIETYEASDLMCVSTGELNIIADRLFRTRGYQIGSRVDRLVINASTGNAALDLMTTASAFKPSRWRCRHLQARGTIFDAELFVTGIRHEITPTSWVTAFDLDAAAPWAATAAQGWDGALWDRGLWANAVELLERGTRPRRTCRSSGMSDMEQPDVLARFEQLVANLEGLFPGVSGAPRAAANVDGYPGNVAAAELIESAWGNATSDKLRIAPRGVWKGVSKEFAQVIPPNVETVITGMPITAPPWAYRATRVNCMFTLGGIAAQATSPTSVTFLFRVGSTAGTIFDRLVWSWVPGESFADTAGHHFNASTRTYMMNPNQSIHVSLFTGANLSIQIHSGSFLYVEDTGPFV